MHIIGKGAPPSPEEQERMTNEYQKKIKKSPMWEMMVKKYGEKKQKKCLKNFKYRLSD